MKKFLIAFLILTAAFGGIVFAAKNTIIKTVMEKAVTSLTGFETQVAKVEYTLPATIRIEGLQIRNPKGRGFEQEIFVSIPEIYASLVLDEILKQKQVHLTEVRLNIEQVNIEKNKEGVSNVELLSSVAPKSETPAPVKPAKAPLPFQLDQFRLTLRNVTYDDHSGVAGLSVPKKVAVDMNVTDQIFLNVTDPKALVNVVLMKIIYGTTFGKLLNINPEKLLTQNLQNVMDSGTQLLNQTAGVMTAQVENVAGQAATLVSENAVTQQAGAVLGQTRQAFGENGVGDKAGVVFGETRTIVGGAATATKKQLGGLFGKLKSTVGTAESPVETTVESGTSAAQS